MLVDTLLKRGFGDVTVLDLSEAALAAAKVRLGDKAAPVQWVAADVTRWSPSQSFDIWHDRAAFHFLTDPADRAAYVARLAKAIKPGGSVIIGTFALDGPVKCSGLPISRYDAASFGKCSAMVSIWSTRGGMSTRPRGRQSSAFSSRYSAEPSYCLGPWDGPDSRGRSDRRAVGAIVRSHMRVIC